MEICSGTENNRIHEKNKCKTFDVSNLCINWHSNYYNIL